MNSKKILLLKKNTVSIKPPKHGMFILNEFTNIYPLFLKRFLLILSISFTKYARWCIEGPFFFKKFFTVEFLLSGTINSNQILFGLLKPIINLLF